MIHIHKYSKWKNIRRDVIEHNRGILIPYLVQEKECEKCGKVKIEIRNTNWSGKTLSSNEQFNQELEKTLQEYGIIKSSLIEYGGYIGDKYYFCCNPSKAVPEFALDYRLFKLDGTQLFYSPIVRMRDICQDCKNLTAGVCYKHKEDLV